MVAVSRFQASSVSPPIPALKTYLKAASCLSRNLQSYTISCATYAPVAVLHEVLEATFL